MIVKKHQHAIASSKLFLASVLELSIWAAVMSDSTGLQSWDLESSVGRSKLDEVLGFASLACLISFWKKHKLAISR